MKSRKIIRMTVCVLSVVLLAGMLGACSPNSAQPSTEPSAAATLTPSAAPSTSVSAAPSPSITPSLEPSVSELSDEDLKGTVEGQTYKNTAAGFEMTYLDDYEIFSEDKIQETMAETVDIINETYNNPDELKLVMQQSIPVSMATKQSPEIYGGSNIIIVDMNEDLPVSIVEYADMAAGYISQSSSAVSVDKAVSAKIGGVEAASLDCVQEASGLTVMQRQYYFVRGEYLVIITVSSNDENELDELVKMAEAIKMQ